MNFFTSDPHFYHKNVIRLCDRPFQDLDHMHKCIIDRWNAIIEPTDTVWVLGDFVWSKAHLGEIVKRLNGKKKLVAGNHDECHPCHHKWAKETNRYLDAGFDEIISDETTIYIEDFKVKLSHFPYWDPNAVYDYEVRYKEFRPVKEDEDFLLHGHSHSKPDKRLKINPLSLDIGVDSNGFYPYSEESIVRTIMKAIENETRHKQTP